MAVIKNSVPTEMRRFQKLRRMMRIEEFVILLRRWAFPMRKCPTIQTIAKKLLRPLAAGAPASETGNADAELAIFVTFAAFLAKPLAQVSR